MLVQHVLITPAVFTPRISEISGEVTGCLYAITASVSSAGMDSRSGGRKLLMNRRTTSCCCGLVNSLYRRHLADLNPALFARIARHQLIQRSLHCHFSSPSALAIARSSPVHPPHK